MHQHSCGEHCSVRPCLSFKRSNHRSCKGLYPRMRSDHTLPVCTAPLSSAETYSRSAFDASSCNFASESMAVVVSVLFGFCTALPPSQTRRPPFGRRSWRCGSERHAYQGFSEVANGNCSLAAASHSACGLSRKESRQIYHSRLQEDNHKYRGCQE